MAKKSKGPRSHYGLVCTVCSSQNYITEINKNNEQQNHGRTPKSMTWMKYCKVCQKHSEHKTREKLK